MNNKYDQQNDYLQSLFLKPFCSKLCDEARTDLDKNITYVQLQKLKRKSEIYHYQNDDPQYNLIGTRKSSNECKNKTFMNNRDKNRNATPYLSRKNEQKLFAEHLKSNVMKKKKQLLNILQQSQKQWLIIKQVNGKVKQNETQVTQSTIKYKNGLEISHIEFQDHQMRRYSASEIKKPFKTQPSTEQSKNINNMMNYYKHKRAIKKMSHLSDSINLTNNQIEQIINLRIQNNSNHTTKEQKQALKSKCFKNFHQRIIVRQKRLKHDNFSEVFKAKQIKSINLKTNLNQNYLKGILSSVRMDIAQKQKLERESFRRRRSYIPGPSKNILQEHSNDLTAWQHSFSRQQTQHNCVI